MLMYHFTLYFAFIDCNTCLRALIFPLDTPLGFFFLPELCIQLGVIVLEVYRKGRDTMPLFIIRTQQFQE